MIQPLPRLTEIRKGRLAYSEVAGKLFTTPAAIRELFRPCPVAPKAPASTSEKEGPVEKPSGSSVTDRLSVSTGCGAGEQAAAERALGDYIAEKFTGARAQGRQPT
jgi:hypothetical protein